MRPKPTILPTVLLLVAALAILFDRTWRVGEVLSPADLFDSFYPWTYDAPRHEPANATRSDEAFYHQPLAATHWPRLNAGDFPEWDPWVLGGTPAFHQGLDVGRAFSPLSAPYYVWSADVATTIYGPLRLLIAGLLMWWYLRAAGLSPAACAVGAAAFGLNGGFLVWLSAPMPTVALWLPLIALGVERVCTRARAQDAALLALGIGCQFLGGYLPTSLVVLVVAAVVAVAAFAGRRPRIDTLAASTRVVAWLTAGGLVGLALGAAALWPMLATLVDSPAGARSMRAFTLPWQNLATFTLPDFWGSPVDRTWWYAGEGNYPEFVTYLGLAPLALAAVALVRHRGPRVIMAAAICALALMQMYGWPPGSWLGALPGLRAVNPFRWNVALAFGLAILAGHGADTFGSRAASTLRDRMWLLAAATTVLLVALLLAGAGLWSELETVRRLGLQAFEKMQIASAGAWGLAAILLVALAAWSSHPRRATFAIWALALLTAADLVVATRGFNPTAPPARLYTTTPGIRFLQQAVGDGRIAPAGPSYLLPESHVWGMFGLPSVTGFDFFGDPVYQAFLRRADNRDAPVPGTLPAAAWDHIGLEHPSSLDLKLLGLLGVSLVVTPPVDVMTHDAGYTTVGALTPGRSLDQRFTMSASGFRRLDLLVATHRGVHAGAWRVTLGDDEGTREMGAWRIDTATLRDLDWMRLEFPTQADSAGRRYRLHIVVEQGAGEQTATLMATPEGGLPGGTLRIDGQRQPGALWLRTFADAPERVPGAVPVYAGDLNIYRNPQSRPPAWFVGGVRVAPTTDHLAMLAEPAFDASATAVIEKPLAVPPAGAEVESCRAPSPDELRCRVHAPQGGVLVFSQRFNPHWRVTADGRPLDLVRANAVLMAAAVPPGTTDVQLCHLRTDWIVSAAVSGLAFLGILIALMSRR